MSEHERHDGSCDDYCEECYDEGYEEGWEEARRAARRNSTPSKSPDGCYVATCVYGSYDCPEVWTLRRFRDFYLKQTLPGRAFVKVYYAVSPSLVRRFGHVERIRRPIKALLDRFVLELGGMGFGSAPYQDE